MAEIKVYVTQTCPYCVAVKQLLDRKQVPYEVIDVTSNDEMRGWLVEQTGQRTVPQVFINGRSVGGFSDVAALDQRGELDPLLKAP